MDYNYNLLLEDISIGREIEFIYKDVTYGIINSSKRWYFVANRKNEYGYYDDVCELISLLETIVIKGKTIREIFDNNEINDVDLTIY